MIRGRSFSSALLVLLAVPARAQTPGAAPGPSSASADSAPTFPVAGGVAVKGTRAPLPEAVVEIPALGIRVVSDGSGRVELGRLPAGRYDLHAERAGYGALDGELEVPHPRGFLVLMNRAVVDDTLAPGRIVGRITEDQGGRRLAGVAVAVVGHDGARTLTDGGGAFELTGLEPGLREVEVSGLGYGSRSVEVVVHPGRTSQMSAALSADPIELEPIEVTVRSRNLERNRFYHRAERGFGTQLDRRDIDEVDASWVSDLVRRRVPGVGLRRDPLKGATYAVSRRGPSRCILPVFIDGVPSGSDLDQIPPEWLAAAEFYQGVETPIRYRGMGASTSGGGVFSGGGRGTPCGVVLLWTQR